MAENKHAGDFDNLIKDLKALKLRIIQQCAVQALAFFKQSFINQGFTDNALVKWKGREGGPKNTGRAVLVNRGVLKRGLRIKKTSIDGAVVGMDDAIPYADIHNYGGEIPITAQMRRFFWAMYYKYGGGQEKGHSQRAQAVNDLANFYRNLAITKDQVIKIPKRQFIGDSATLERQLKTYITGELDKYFQAL